MSRGVAPSGWVTLRGVLPDPRAGHFDKPVVYMFDKQGEPEWKVTADTGVLNTDDNVILRDKVHLDGLLPTSFISTLDTPIWSWIW